MDQSLFDFTRNLISPLDARILRDAYGYTIWDPDDLPTLEEPPLYQHLHCNYYHPELPPDIDCREFAINVPPTLEEIDDRTVSEGSLLTVQATARDQNPGQVLTFSLGPGAPAGATIHPNTGLFRWTPPDGPTVVTIAVRVSDGDAEGLSDTETFTVTVTNAPPTATFGGPASGVRGQPLSFTGSFSDPGADTWTATVDFGDGTGVQPLALNADKTFAVSHAFAAEGDYTVTFTVKDDDQGTAVVRRAVAIKVWDMPADPTDPSMTALVVGGTPGNDNIQVHPVGSTGSVEVLVNSVSLGTFTPTGRIIIFGQAGDDNIHVATAVANPAELYGGGGNDRINAGSGNTLLTGGEGDDDLIGGNGRDLLLGGMGRDSLLGANGDDILIGGVTAWDNDPQALRAILSEWTRTDRDYRERVTDLQNGGGLNGSYKLNADFVFADGAEDRLTGGGDLDFVFYDALDSVIGLLEKEEGILVD